MVVDNEHMADATVIAKYDYRAQESQELDIQKHERLTLLDDKRNWWKVSNAKGQVGYVPSNYVRRETSITKNGVEANNGIFDKFTPRNGSKTGGVNNQTLNDILMAPGTSRFILDSQGNRMNINNNKASPSSDAIICYAKVKFIYEPQRPDELKLDKGATVVVHEKCSDGWWRGSCNNQQGWFPSNYVIEGGNDATPYNPPNLPPSPNQVSSVLETVLCLYKFTAQNPEELSFEKGEKLDIIEHPAHDPEWYRAVNSHGDSGLVPTNYIQVIKRHDEPIQPPPPQQVLNNFAPFVPGSLVSDHASRQGASMSRHQGVQTPSYYRQATSGAFADKPWYYGQLSRDVADSLLNTYASDGDFLVRDSESNPGDFSISLKAAIRNKHFWVQVEDNRQYKIGNRHFANMDELIEHYTVQPIYTNEKTNEKLYLVLPLQP